MAYDFNGTTDHLELSSALLTTTPLSIYARFRTDTVAAGNAVIASISGSSGLHVFQLRRSGQNLEASVSEGAAIGTASIAIVVIAGSEYSATAVFSSSASRTAYLGSALSTTDTTAVTPTSLDRTNVGARYNAGAPGAFFDGKICEVAFWNEALTQAEHQQMNAGACPAVIRPHALVAYFPLIANTNDLKQQRSLTASGAIVAPHLWGRRMPRQRVC